MEDCASVVSLPGFSAPAVACSGTGVANALDVGVTLVQAALVAALVVLAARARSRSAAIALAALAPAVFLLTNRVLSSQFLVLLVGVWALAAALVVVSEREQLAVGAAMAGATFANALVHPYTVPAAWEHPRSCSLCRSA